MNRPHRILRIGTQLVLRQEFIDFGFGLHIGIGMPFLTYRRNRIGD